MLPHRHQKTGMGSSDFEVVVHDRDRSHNFVEKFLTIVTGLSSRQLHSNLKLRHGDRGNRYIVLVIDNGI